MHVYEIIGVYMSNDLKWDTNIHYTKVLTGSRFFALRTLRPFLADLLQSTLLLNTVVLICWTQRKNLLILDKIQTIFHHFLCHFHCHCVNLSPLVTRGIDAAIKMFRSAGSDPTHVLHNIVATKSCNFIDSRLQKLNANLHPFSCLPLYWSIPLSRCN